MRLADFIRDNHEAILKEWEAFARTLRPAAEGMNKAGLRDHADEILTAIVRDMEALESAAEKSAKSKGHGHKAAEEHLGGLAHPHAVIRYTSKGDLRGEWDSDRLAQVLSNLVGNALQHGDADQPINVLAQGHDEEVELAIHNAGSPIPAGEVNRIFEPNVRNVQDPTKAPTGLGLGLYIAKELVTAHGGTLAVTSTDADATTYGTRIL